jgi:hypothetical protein
MKAFFASLLISVVAVTAQTTPLKPVRLQALSLQNVALKEGERIASIEVEVSGASFRNVRIPIDWSFDVAAPISGVAVLKGEAAHGVGMLFSTGEFQRFLCLASYGSEQRQFGIKVRLGLYRNDPVQHRESETVLEIPAECIVLEEEAAWDRPRDPLVTDK